MQIIAHRGYHVDYPENSMAAFDAALEIGADALETDVLVTKDRRLAVLHDDFIARKGEFAYVHELTFEELQSIDLGRGQRIPSLEEFYDRYQETLPLVLDLKMKQGFDVFLEFLKKRSIENIHLTSVMHEWIASAKEVFPQVSASLNIVSVLPGTAQWFRQAGIECASVFRGSLTPKALNELAGEGVRARVYTVNMLREAQHWADCGVEAIYSDNLKQMQPLRQGS